MALSQDNRRTLTERVARQVAGRGISRSHIEDVVDRVARALDARLNDPVASRASAARADIDADHPSARAPDGEILAVFSAADMPDLASRTRRALVDEGVTIARAGSATMGRHTVVTVRVPAASEALVRRVAERLGARCAISRDEGGDR